MRLLMAAQTLNGVRIDMPAAPFLDSALSKKPENGKHRLVQMRYSLLTLRMSKGNLPKLYLTEYKMRKL